VVRRRAPWNRRGPSLHRLLEGWRNVKESATLGFVWLRSLRPPAVPIGGGVKIVLTGHTASVRAVALASAPGRSEIVAGRDDGNVQIWQTENVSAVKAFGAVRQVRSLAISHDGRRVAAGMDNGRIQLWDLGLGEEIARFGESLRAARSLSFSPNGLRLAIGDDDGHVWILEPMAARSSAQIRNHTANVNNLSLLLERRTWDDVFFVRVASAAYLARALDTDWTEVETSARDDQS
jgi:WD40 repeat protein